MADKSKKIRVLIAASGTGGHLFPAVDIADAFREINPEIEVEFVGSGRPLEEKIVDAKGYKRTVIHTVGIKQRGILGLIEFVKTFPEAFFQTWSLFSRFKPSVVVGVGGYVSFLPVVMAWFRMVPRWIHEAERNPGMANRFLAYITDRISVAFSDAKIPCRKKAVYTGQPVRKIFKEIAETSTPNIPPQNLLITGGSQGARALDLTIKELVPLIKQYNLRVKHQCRPENVDLLKAAYSEAGVEAEVFDFMSDLPEAYRWSDLMISRAGAGTTMEVSVVNRPTIFVPFPYAQGNHQFLNAKILADAGKALIVEEGDNFKERLADALEKLLNPNTYKAMRETPYRSRSLDAAHDIAEGCLKLVNL